MYHTSMSQEEEEEQEEQEQHSDPPSSSPPSRRRSKQRGPYHSRGEREHHISPRIPGSSIGTVCFSFQAKSVWQGKERTHEEKEAALTWMRQYLNLPNVLFYEEQIPTPGGTSQQQMQQEKVLYVLVSDNKYGRQLLRKQADRLGLIYTQWSSIPQELDNQLHHNA